MIGDSDFLGQVELPYKMLTSIQQSSPDLPREINFKLQKRSWMSRVSGHMLLRFHFRDRTDDEADHGGKPAANPAHEAPKEAAKEVLQHRASDAENNDGTYGVPDLSQVPHLTVTLHDFISKKLAGYDDKNPPRIFVQV